MKIKIINGFEGPGLSWVPGQEVDVDAEVAARMVERGHAELVRKMTREKAAKVTREKAVIS